MQYQIALQQNRDHGPTCTIEDYLLASVFQPPQNDIEFPTYFALRHARYRPSLKGITPPSLPRCELPDIRECCLALVSRPV